MSTFILLFFFTYASVIERNIVISQTEDLVDSLVGQSGVLLKDKTSIRNLVLNIPVQDMSTEDERLQKQNLILVKKASLIIGLFAGCLILVVIGLVVYYRLDWKKILVTNIILLFVVACVEFVFLTFIAQNYKSFDPNYVRYVILGELQKIKSSPVNIS
jgi:glucan phosphoethanolaminetransferase (alkaline phosphatase superfamily)